MPWVHVRVDSMTKICYPPLPAKLSHHLTNLLLKVTGGRVQGTGVKVPLKSYSRTNETPAIMVHSPQ